MEHGNEVNNYNAMALIAGIALLCVAVWWQPVQNYLRGLKMKRIRREEIQTTVLDGITDFVEDLIADGKLTRDEAIDEIYNPLKRVFHNKAIYPAEERLKERIEKRMKSGTHAPVPLPDATTPSAKVKHLFDKTA